MNMYILIIYMKFIYLINFYYTLSMLIIQNYIELLKITGFMFNLYADLFETMLKSMFALQYL